MTKRGAGTGWHRTFFVAVCIKYYFNVIFSHVILNEDISALVSQVNTHMGSSQFSVWHYSLKHALKHTGSLPSSSMLNKITFSILNGTETTLIRPLSKMMSGLE